ncbi:MarR family winged helix-turn-helix transcriptional regulator [Catenuloplanes sp. NPDC051500]|uniref:MarR family winged helix-turn-helix transcriptional regulator n=1 Tax=Catenuloplanes sp. NPDC051500 TaxID=3363959 RepID=UPI0037B51EEE
MAHRAEQAEEASRLARLLVDIAERSKADFADSANELGIPVHLARALALLTGPVPMRDLAALLRCDRSYVTAIADQLEERGLLTRIPGADRRVKLLTLTDAGRDLQSRLTAAIAAGNALLIRLDDADRVALAPLLERLAPDDSDLTSC